MVTGFRRLFSGFLFHLFLKLRDSLSLLFHLPRTNSIYLLSLPHPFQPSPPPLTRFLFPLPFPVLTYLPLSSLPHFLYLISSFVSHCAYSLNFLFRPNISAYPSYLIFHFLYTQGTFIFTLQCCKEKQIIQIFQNMFPSLLLSCGNHSANLSFRYRAHH